MIAFTFPGQGSQRPAMGAPWQGRPSWELVERASDATGRDVARLLLTADAEELRQTHDEQTFGDRLEIEYDNLRATMAWAVERKEAEIALRLTRAMGAHWEVRGYHVPRGTTLLLSQWVVQRDGRFFDEPDAFRPERWADGLAQRLPKFAYFPFGGGPRVCIGNQFALLETVLVLATLGTRYRFTLAPNDGVEPLPTFTLRPHPGVPTVLTPRGAVREPVEAASS